MFLRINKILSSVFTAFLLLSVFADGSNLDDFILESQVIHYDIPAIEINSNLNQNKSSIITVLNNINENKDNFASNKSLKFTNKHIAYDQDSPSCPVEIINKEILFIPIENDLIITYQRTQDYFPLYILHCSLIL